MSTWMRRWRLRLTLIGLAVGLLLTLIGIFGAALPSSATPTVMGIDSALEWLADGPGGNWAMVSLVVGALMVVGFVWWLVDLITRHRKFNEIMAIESRNQFVKQQEEAEFIAWKLYGDYANRLAEKKRSLRIKE